MIVSSRHVGIIVQDLKKSLKFFQDILQLEIWKHDTESGPFIEALVGLSRAKIEWVKLKLSDNFAIELLQYHSHPAQSVVYMPQIGTAHIALTVNRLDEIYEKLVAENYKCNSPPLLSPDGKVKVLYCYGPDGITLELVEEIK